MASARPEGASPGRPRRASWGRRDRVKHPFIHFFDALEIDVHIVDTSPKIWRRLLVPARVPLHVVHDALQIAFGWQDYHLHDFRAGGVRFTIPHEDDEVFAADERTTPLGAVMRADSPLVYTYDFGDHWQHEVALVRVHQDAAEGLRCLDGARACPPEDCGGTAEYEHLVAVLADPEHEEHADLRTWVGRKFDAEKFDLAAVNKKLAVLSRRHRLVGRKPARDLQPRSN